MKKSENKMMLKKLYSELVFGTVYIEGLNITFPQTQTILDGYMVEGLQLHDITTIINLRDAWSFMLRTLDEPLTLNYMNKVNDYVSRGESLEWGVLRTGNVGVSGTSFRPTIPNKETVKRRIRKVVTDPTKDNILRYYAEAIRSQYYWDGNKRTQMIIVNKLLVQQGYGLLYISEHNALEFNEQLSAYYNTGNIKPFVIFLKQAIVTW